MVVSVSVQLDKSLNHYCMEWWEWQSMKNAETHLCPLQKHQIWTDQTETLKWNVINVMEKAEICQKL